MADASPAAAASAPEPEAMRSAPDAIAPAIAWSSLTVAQIEKLVDEAQRELKSRGVLKETQTGKAARMKSMLECVIHLYAIATHLLSVCSAQVVDATRRARSKLIICPPPPIPPPPHPPTLPAPQQSGMCGRLPT
eukprot:SAG11_NODE_262_length_11529_cov_12.277603_5_plen_135_part_00